MKILLCFLSYISPELRLAGGTTHFIENLRAWCKSGEEIHVLSTGDAASLLGQLPVGCEIESVNLGTRSLMKSSLGISITLLFRVFHILFRFNPGKLQFGAEVICTESHFLPDVLAAVLARRHSPHAQLISYLHHIVPRPSNRRYHGLLPSVLSWIAQTLSLRLMKHFGFYVLTFPMVGSQLEDLGFLKSKIRYITNGVNIEAIERIPPTRRKFHACFLGNAIPRKGVFDLPQVWRHVCDSVPEAKLAIMGTGREQDIMRLQRSFRDRKLSDNVQFLGYLSEYEKLATLKASSLFLFPSYEEGWGIAISEAMAAGLPVVAYDLPAYRTAFKRGIVTVPLGSISDLARATVMLLKDDVKRTHLGQDGKEQAEEYDSARVPGAELTLIKEICK